MSEQSVDKRQEVRAKWNRTTVTFFYVTVPIAFLAAGIVNFEIYGRPLNGVTLGFVLGNVFGLLVIPALIVLICHFAFRKSERLVPIPHVIGGIVLLFMIYSSYTVAQFETTGSLSP